MRSFCCAHCSVSGSQRSPARKSARSVFVGCRFWMSLPSGSSRRMARNAVGAVNSVCTPCCAITRQKAPASGVPTGLPSKRMVVFPFRSGA